MLSFKFRNINEAYPRLVDRLLNHRDYTDQQVYAVGSRNGPVVRFRGPVGVTYTHPTERVLFDANRDANPFFHMYEAMWMLAGRNDVEGPARYAKNLRNYSDDGETFHGAYGFRWRQWFGYDQLEVIIDELRENPSSRRCVLQMWDASANGEPPVKQKTVAYDLVTGRNDLYTATHGGVDVPCNVNIFFEVERVYDGPGGEEPSLSEPEYHYQLNMTVCNRSNDLVWGALGANYVHFTFLQEYVAANVGVEVGTYTQISNNLHLYTEVHKDLKPEPWHELNEPAKPMPLVKPSEVDSFDEHLNRTLTDVDQNVSPANWSSWLFHTFGNAMTAHFYHRYKERTKALQHAERIECPAWRKACREWLERRYA